MTDVELMEQCRKDAKKIVEAGLNRTSYFINLSCITGISQVAVELFNFRSERLGMQLKATL